MMWLRQRRDGSGAKVVQGNARYVLLRCSPALHSETAVCQLLPS